MSRWSRLMLRGFGFGFIATTGAFVACGLMGYLESNHGIPSAKSLTRLVGQPLFVVVTAMLAAFLGALGRQPVWTATGMALPYPLVAWAELVRPDARFGRFAAMLMTFAVAAWLAAFIFARVGKDVSQWSEARRTSPALPANQPETGTERDKTPAPKPILISWAIVAVAVGLWLAWMLEDFWRVSGIMVAGWIGFAWIAVKRGRVNSAFVLVVAAIPAVLFGALILARMPQDRHVRELRRIEGWAARSQAFPPAGITRGQWRSDLVAIHNSLYNALFRPDMVPTAKVRELADYLDATQGRDFATVAGVLGLIGYLEEICPHAKAYGPFEMVRTEYPGATPARIAPGRK